MLKYYVNNTLSIEERKMAKGKDKNQIVQGFKKRKKRQIIITIPAVIVMILVAILATNPEYKDIQLTSDLLILGVPSTILAFISAVIILACVVASFFNWRCPACNSYLGKSVSPRFCAVCGVKFEDHEHSASEPVHKEEDINRKVEGDWDQEITANLDNDVKLELIDKQNMPLALLGGFVSAVVCAIIWAYITYITGIQIGFMAIGVGLLVGYTVRILGKGISTRFGIIGATFSLLGCLAGNILAICIVISQQESMLVLEVLSYLDIGVTTQLLIDTFNPKDLLFYALAIYEGYKFSFKQLINHSF
jgi:hypothetical protein